MDGNLEGLSLDAEDTRQRPGRGLAPSPSVSPSVPPPMAIATTVHCTERSGEKAGFWLTPEPHLTPQGNRCRHPPWRGFPLVIAMTALAPGRGRGRSAKRGRGGGRKGVLCVGWDKGQIWSVHLESMHEWSISPYLAGPGAWERSPPRAKPRRTRRVPVGGDTWASRPSHEALLHRQILDAMLHWRSPIPAVHGSSIFPTIRSFPPSR